MVTMTITMVIKLIVLATMWVSNLYKGNRSQNYFQQSLSWSQNSDFYYHGDGDTLVIIMIITVYWWEEWKRIIMMIMLMVMLIFCDASMKDEVYNDNGGQSNNAVNIVFAIFMPLAKSNLESICNKLNPLL